jgi:hypothetical protein
MYKLDALIPPDTCNEPEFAEVDGTVPKTLSVPELGSNDRPVLVINTGTLEPAVVTHVG